MTVKKTGALSAFAAAELDRHRNAVIYSDLSKCVPAGALSPWLRRGCWKLIPYEAGKIRGNLVWAGEESNARPLRLRLKEKGWHAIFAGLYDRAPAGRIWLKLRGDMAPQPFVTGFGRGHDGGIEEVFYKAACLDNSEVEISQQTTGFTSCGGLAYLKLVPLSEREIAGIEKDRALKSNRRLVATIDGYSYIHFRKPTTREELLKEIEIYRDTDFGTLVLQLGGSDHANYPSKHGGIFGENMEVFPDTGRRYYFEAVRELARKKINPTRVLIEGAHKLGMKVHIGMRLGWLTYEPYREFFESQFYAKNPQWRCVDKDGTEVARMSWAVPEVRKRLIEKLREAVRLGSDGVSILFNRGVPMVLYEKAFIRIFRKRHGFDPRNISETDPRNLRLRSKIVTTFFRELRAMLDEEAARRPAGRKLEISAVVFPSEANNLIYGIDLRGLAAAGLIDEVYPLMPGNLFGSTRDPFEASFYRELSGKRGIPFKPVFVCHSCRLHNYDVWIKKLRLIYARKPDGILLWDPNGVAAVQSPRCAWLTLARLGHVEEFLAHSRLPPPERVSAAFQKLGKIRMDLRYPCHWGT